MKLGAFSISLAVKDLTVSKEFYGKLGFEETGGGEGYAILVNGPTVIGLFQGMFEDNILTFNPGWKGPHENDESFTDVRELCKELKSSGVAIKDDHTQEAESGPAYFTLIDPDGNAILVDQHV